MWKPLADSAEVNHIMRGGLAKSAKVNHKIWDDYKKIRRINIVIDVIYVNSYIFGKQNKI